MDFIELPDGTLINAAGIFRLEPEEKANRISYFDGRHETLATEYADVIRKALKPCCKEEKPKPPRKTRKSQTTGGVMG